MKTLFLSSDGKFIIEKGFKIVFGDISKVKLAYITTAVKEARNIDHFVIDKNLLKKRNYDFEEIDIEGKNEEELREILKDKNAIFVEGGNPFYLLKVIKDTGFDKVLEELIDKGIPYFGASAGSYIACPTIEMSAWKKPGEEKPRFGLEDLTALNLVPFLIKVHYTPEQKEFLKEKIAGAKYPVKILADGQALLVRGDKIELIGEGEEMQL